MKIRHIVIIVIFILINAGVVMTLNFGGGQQEEGQKESKFIQVLKATEIENKKEKFSVSGYGTITSFNAVDIACEVQGRLNKGANPLKTGVKFRKGQIIFHVDDTEARYNLRSRKSGFINIIAQMLPDIKVDFPSEFQKWEDYVGEIKLNRSLPILPAWKSKKEKIFLSTRNVLTEYFAIQSMEEQLKKYHVSAPFNGVVTDVFVSDHSVVNPGTPVLRLAQTDNFEVAVSIPAGNLEDIEVGTSCDIFTTTGKQKGVGKVVRISEIINKSTQSVDVFVQPKAFEGEQFIEGEYVQVMISEPEEYVGARIPLNAVVESDTYQQQVFIYSKHDSTLQKKTVQVLDKNEQGVFVSGLQDRDIVITQEVLSYTDSTKYGVLIK